MCWTSGWKRYVISFSKCEITWLAQMSNTRNYLKTCRRSWRIDKAKSWWQQRSWGARKDCQTQWSRSHRISSSRWNRRETNRRSLNKHSDKRTHIHTKTNYHHKTFNKKNSSSDGLKKSNKNNHYINRMNTILRMENRF